jgi:glycerol-3-phosphate dehydrogenase
MIPEFSFRTRQQNLERLASEAFDVLVIGGGITGAGVARDAAMRGLSVALVERDDFASGTSSKSTKLVHGGLRYLTTFDFRLVYESCRERHILGRIAAPLCQPLPLVYPCYGDSSRELLLRSAGMWFYETLALFRNVRWHRTLGPGRTLELEPGLRRERLRGSSVHYDLLTNDAWLTLATVVSAHRHGAVIANHVAATEFRGSGRVRECVLREALSGQELSARAKVIVNASGPWLDEVRRLAGSVRTPALCPSKGVHLVIPRQRMPIGNGVLWDWPEDRRILVAIPWGNVTLVGTTETPPTEDWSSAVPSEVEYLLRAANYVFPEANLALKDVSCVFSGVRPLLRSDRPTLTAASRAHKVFEDPDGLISVGGGKLTTYRAMAEEVVDLVLRRLGKKAGPCRTAETPLDEEAGPPSLEKRDRPSRLRKRYGAGARAVEDILAQDPELGKPIAPGLPYMLAELDYGVRYEMAMTLEDSLERRVPILYEDQNHGFDALRPLADRMAEMLGWTEAMKNERMEHYHQTVQRSVPYDLKSS